MKSSFLSILLAAFYGLTIRLLYPLFNGLLHIMSLSFILLGPVLVGFLTVIFIPRRKRISGPGAFFLPWLTALVILVITMMVNLEGAICWIMIYPLFAIMAGIGGLIANAVRSRRRRRDQEDEFNAFDMNRRNLSIATVLLIMPLVTGALEGDKTLSRKDFKISRSIVISATPETIWNAIVNINTVGKGEKHTSFTNALGFPYHLYTTLDMLQLGGHRKAVYEGGLFFDETITRYEPGRMMELSIKTDPKKIPPTVLDEHIVIGGKHVDMVKDIYHLEALPDGTSRLSLESQFWINTPFNWYAGIWAKWLMNDLLSGELELVRDRALKP